MYSRELSSLYIKKINHENGTKQSGEEENKIFVKTCLQCRFSFGTNYTTTTTTTAWTELVLIKFVAIVVVVVGCRKKTTKQKEKTNKNRKRLGSRTVIFFSID